MNNKLNKVKYRIVSQQRKNGVTIESIEQKTYFDLQAEEIWTNKQLLSYFSKNDYQILFSILE